MTPCRMCLAVVMTLALAVSGPQVAHAGFTYDTDPQGWTMAYTDTYTSGPLADHSSTDGQPAGSIYQSVGTSGYGAYALALLDVDLSLGDLTGKTLEADIRSTGNWQAGAHARWVILDKVNGVWNIYISKHAQSVALDFTGWQAASVDLVEANFFRWPNASVAPGDPEYKDFDALMNGYNRVGLQLLGHASDDPAFWNSHSNIGYFGAWAASDTATWGLDNFRATPEPATLALVGLGLGGLVARRRCGRR